MHPFLKIILAESDAERDEARAALHRSNAETPTDREAIFAFLKDCTTLDGAPFMLNDAGSVVTLQ